MTKRVIRVFPYRTSYTPDDEYVFIGDPPLPCLIPEHDEVHVSCTFTWDKKRCEDLAFQWEGWTDKPVKLGGPAFGSPADDFQQGMYIKRNIIFTSRGCNNNCPWCCVPKREGKLRELPICEGNWIQDNNFLQTSRQHKEKVFEMLKKQRRICFKGGLETDLIDDHFVEGLLSIGPSHIDELWLACDTDAEIPALKKACEKLGKAGFSREKMLCYCLSYGKDMAKDEARALAIWEAGAMPFVQLYQDFGDTRTEYPKEWRDFQTRFSRPAIAKAYVKQLEGGKINAE